MADSTCPLAGAGARLCLLSVDNGRCVEWDYRQIRLPLGVADPDLRGYPPGLDFARPLDRQTQIWDPTTPNVSYIKKADINLRSCTIIMAHK